MLIIEEVLLSKMRNPNLTWSETLRNQACGKNIKKYYRSRRGYGHLIDEFFDLREKIQTLVKREKVEEIRQK